MFLCYFYCFISFLQRASFCQQFNKEMCYVMLCYSRRDSVTQILLITGLPSFTNILHNAKQVFKQCIESCPNSLILMFNSLQAGCVYWWYVTFIK